MQITLQKKPTQFAYWFYLCGFTLLSPAYSVSEKLLYKGLMLMHGVAFRKKGIFDEAMQTQANCIIQESKNMHL